MNNEYNWYKWLWPEFCFAILLVLPMSPQLWLFLNLQIQGLLSSWSTHCHQGLGYILVTSDQGATSNAAQKKNDHDKKFKMSKKILLWCIAEAGDTEQFAEYIRENMHLWRSEVYVLSPTTNFKQKNVAGYLWSQTCVMYTPNCL